VHTATFASDILDESTINGSAGQPAPRERHDGGARAHREQGGEILSGGKEIAGCYVQPTLVARASGICQILKEEIFAPNPVSVEFDALDEAIHWHNEVPQGLSSAMSLRQPDLRRDISISGSDCGIANINIGTSGAEIGGAFGGEKETGRATANRAVFGRLHAAADQYDHWSSPNCAGAGYRVRPLRNACWLQLEPRPSGSGVRRFDSWLYPRRWIRSLDFFLLIALRIVPERFPQLLDGSVLFALLRVAMPR